MLRYLFMANKAKDFVNVLDREKMKMAWVVRYVVDLQVPHPGLTNVGKLLPRVGFRVLRLLTKPETIKQK